MKRRIEKIIALLLLTVMIFMEASPVTALALDTVLADGMIAYVWSDGAFDDGEYYSDVTDAWNAACEQGNVLMLADWNPTQVLTVPKNKTVSVYMDGHTMDRGLSSAKKNGEVFIVSNRAKLKIYGTDTADIDAKSETARITGGYNVNGAGAIHIRDNAAVYLYGVTVTENRTIDSRGGGAIRFHGESSRLEMNSHTYITNNYAIGTSGGAISVIETGCIIIGGNICNNEADKNGGAIAAFDGSVSVRKAIITENKADGHGGAVYADEDSSVSLSNCIIKNNESGENGGGLYVDGKASLSDGIVQGNTAGLLGGGAYVNAEGTIGLSGNLTVNENTDSAEESIVADNVYLHTDDGETAKISDYPSSGEVRIGWDSALQESTSFKLSDSDGIYSTRFLICDVEGYHFYWSWDTEDGKNDKYIWADTTNYSTEIEPDVMEVPVSERYHVIKNGYLGKYDLQEGLLGSKSSSLTSEATVYFYSDGYFAGAPDVYNPSLSTMSMVLAISAFNSGGSDFGVDIPNDSYANSFRDALMMLSDIGIEDQNMTVNEGFKIEPTEDTIGVAMGAKEISLDGEEYILIPIAVRGSGYGAEWASNVTLGTEGEAYGFSSASNQVVEEVEKFIDSNTSFDISTALENGKVKFWVVGFSRGGAVANITAKRLTDIYGESGNAIYGYSFEAPKGGTDASEIKEAWTYNGVYANIRNVINDADIVTQIAPKEMGFKRYGVDHYTPGTDAGEIVTTVYETPTGLTVTTHADNSPYGANDSDYVAMRTEMKRYLAAINSSVIFYDYFALANIDYLGIIGGSDLVSEIETDSTITAGKWLEAFINDLVAWSGNGTYTDGAVNNGGYNNDYRDFYTSNSEFAGQELVTIENALKFFMNMLANVEESEELMSVLSLRLGSYVSKFTTLFDLYFYIINKWDELSAEKQTELLDNIWDCFYTEMEYAGAIPVETIEDLVPPEDLDEFKSSIYSLFTFLFLFVCRDNDEQPSLDNVSATQVHLATFLYNASTILSFHNFDICLAWLNAYDENYSADNENSKFVGSAVYLVEDEVTVPPEIETEIEIEEESITVHLSSIINSSNGVDASSTNNGSAIYYAVYENGVMVDDWQLYKTPFELDKTKDVEYSVKTFAARFAERGKEYEIDDDQLRGIVKDKDSSDLSYIFIIIGAIILLLSGSILIFIIKRKRAKKQSNTTSSVGDNK